jgi:hypothetical protein
MTNGNAISTTSQEITSQEQLVRVVYEASGTHYEYRHTHRQIFSTH